MPYAIDGKISKAPIDGAIEITDEQYKEALQAQLQGKKVAVRDGGLRILRREKKTVYNTEDKSKLEIPENEDIPEGYTDKKLPGDEYKWDDDAGEWVEDIDKILDKKIKEVEAERVKRTELMPFTAPDGENVEVKLREDAPSKPRQTWLSGKATKAESRIRRELDMDDVDGDKYLIAADDSRHEMTADDWIDLGEKMDSWITGHLFAASQHIQAVRDLESVEEIKDYDITAGWPE